MTGLTVSCRRVVHIYRAAAGDVVALAGVDLTIGSGEMVALVGPSGSGKSTLIALLAGMMRPSAGRVTIGTFDMGRLSDAELSRLRGTQIGVVVQGAARNLLPSVNLRRNIALAQRRAARTKGVRLDDPDRVLDLVGLGGQGQGPGRAAAARGPATGRARGRHRGRTRTVACGRTDQPARPGRGRRGRARAGDGQRRARHHHRGGDPRRARSAPGWAGWSPSATAGSAPRGAAAATSPWWPATARSSFRRRCSTATRPAPCSWWPRSPSAGSCSAPNRRSRWSVRFNEATHAHVRHNRCLPGGCSGPRQLT